MNLVYEIYAALLPAVLSVIATFVGFVLVRATEVARTRWGIEIEATHRDALHAALMSGIRSALQRGLTGQAAVSAAITHASRSVPDALAALDPTPDVLASIAEAKLRDALPGRGA